MCRKLGTTLMVNSLHPCADPDAIQQKSFRSHGSSLQSQHSPGHAHAAQTENRPEQASQHTQRAAKASRTSGIAPQQQSGVDSQAADALTAGQQRPPGMGQTAGASSNADCLQLPQLKAQVPPSIGGLPEQAMHSLEQTEQQGLTQSKQQGLSQLEPLRLSLGTQPQHAPSEHQEPCSGSAVQEVDAVCSQLAASTMESVELNSMQQLLQLCGQDVSNMLSPDRNTCLTCCFA